ncbi:hypothetical protein RFI_08804, partial [Reticulomyxa filosa]
MANFVIKEKSTSTIKTREEAGRKIGRIEALDENPEALGARIEWLAAEIKALTARIAIETEEKRIREIKDSPAYKGESAETVLEIISKVSEFKDGSKEIKIYPAKFDLSESHEAPNPLDKTISLLSDEPVQNLDIKPKISLELYQLDKLIDGDELIHLKPQESEFLKSEDIKDIKNAPIINEKDSKIEDNEYILNVKQLKEVGNYMKRILTIATILCGVSCNLAVAGNSAPYVKVEMGIGMHVNKPHVSRDIQHHIISTWTKKESQPTPQGGYKQTFKVQSFMANLYNDMPISNNIAIYAGGGIGCAEINPLAGKYVGKDGVTSHTYGKASTNFAYNLTAGISFNISKNTKLDIGYRFNDYGKNDATIKTANWRSPYEIQKR